MSESVEHVETVHETEDRTVEVYYIRNASDNAKAPKYNALVAMPSPWDGIVSTWPIFQSDKDGSFSVTLPGNKGFPSFKPANRRHADGSLLAEVSGTGKANLDALRQAVYSGFLNFRRTGVAEQIVSI